MAEAGLRVALLDRQFPGSGTSRATQAALGVYSKKPRANLELNMKGAELFPSLVARLETDTQLQRDGSLQVVFSEQDVPKMRAFIAKQKETPGYTAEVLTGDQARELEPALSKEVVAAAFCPLDGQVNPLLYVDALARGVVRLGGHVKADSEVRGIEKLGHQLWRVITDDGDLPCAWVVNCAGIDAPSIGRMVGIDVPIIPNRGHVLVTEPVPPLIKRRLGGPIMIRQMAEGNLLLGQSEEAGESDRSESLPVLVAQAKVAQQVLPSLEKVKIIRVFVGLRPWPPDGMPILGEVPGLPGFLVAVGHSGITWSPAVGRLMMELVTTGKTFMSLKPYSITRFETKAAQA
jgi:sarcosine oxidase subunit beta